MTLIISLLNDICTHLTKYEAFVSIPTGSKPFITFRRHPMIFSVYIVGDIMYCYSQHWNRQRVHKIVGLSPYAKAIAPLADPELTNKICQTLDYYAQPEVIDKYNLAAFVSLRITKDDDG